VTIAASERFVASDEANVDLNDRRATDASNLPLLQHA
jgi:hypothetical protein